MKNYYVYMLASGKNGTLYIGVTNNLIRRVVEHKRKIMRGFTKRYYIDKLVWYEQTNDIRFAIQKENQLKNWPRKWKVREIEKENSEWKDLFFEIGGSEELLKENMF